jgi:hypothetical protein
VGSPRDGVEPRFDGRHHPVAAVGPIVSPTNGWVDLDVAVRLRLQPGFPRMSA